MQYIVDYIEIILLVSIIALILSTILLFKIWGMAKNAKKIKDDLKTIVELNFISCENTEVRKNICFAKMKKVFGGFSGFNNVKKNTIDRRVVEKSSQLQKIIDTYRCSNVYSIEDFKKELYVYYKVN